MLGWGHSKKRQRTHPTKKPDTDAEPEAQAGSAAVQRLMIVLRDGSTSDEVPANS